MVVNVGYFLLVICWVNGELEEFNENFFGFLIVVVDDFEYECEIKIL